MKPIRLNPRARHILDQAKQNADANVLDKPPSHRIILAIAQNPECLAAQCLLHHGVNLETIRQSLAQPQPSTPSPSLPPDDTFAAIVRTATHIARIQDLPYAGTAQLLSACLHREHFTPALNFLANAGVTDASIVSTSRRIMGQRPTDQRPMNVAEQHVNADQAPDAIRNLSHHTHVLSLAGDDAAIRQALLNFAVANSMLLTELNMPGSTSEMVKTTFDDTKGLNACILFSNVHQSDQAAAATLLRHLMETPPKRRLFVIASPSPQQTMHAITAPFFNKLVHLNVGANEVTAAPTP